MTSLSRWSRCKPRGFCSPFLTSWRESLSGARRSLARAALAPAVCVAAFALSTFALSACSEDEPILPSSNGGGQQEGDPPFRELDGDGVEEPGGTTRPPPQPNGDAVNRGLGGASSSPYPRPDAGVVDGGGSADAGDAG